MKLSLKLIHIEDEDDDENYENRKRFLRKSALKRCHSMKTCDAKRWSKHSGTSSKNAKFRWKSLISWISPLNSRRSDRKHVILEWNSWIAPMHITAKSLTVMNEERVRERWFIILIWIQRKLPLRVISIKKTDDDYNDYCDRSKRKQIPKGAAETKTSVLRHPKMDRSKQNSRHSSKLVY